MWIISFLPDFVTHLIVFVGIVGILLTSIPLIWKLIPGLDAYRQVMQLLCIVLLCFGLYLEGGVAVEAEYKVKVAELKIKLKDAELKAAKVNTVIITEYINKKQVIKEKGDTIREYIDREVAVYDKTCPIPESVIKSHNAAAKGDVSILVPTAEHNALATSPMKLAPKK